MRMLNLFFGGLGSERLAFGSELMPPAPAPARPSLLAPAPEAGRSQVAPAPAPAPLQRGRMAERHVRFAATEMNAMLELTGGMAASGLFEGLLASHLLGCAVANASQAAPALAVITLNHRVICKAAAAADTDIHIATRVTRTDWNHRLNGWVVELDGEAQVQAGTAVLMAAHSTLLLRSDA